MSQSPTHLIVGPARHGVVAFAVALVDALTVHDRPAPVLRLDSWADLDDALARLEVGGVHLNFTDRLFGATPGEAADRVGALVGHAAGHESRVTATLHDVPQRTDGGNYPQRVDAYRRVCDAVHGIATNSEHERSLLGESGIARPADVVVIPLPVHVSAAPTQRPGDGRRSVAVMGFVYPGKGHPEVLAAMEDLPSDVEFLVVGECSAGHDDLATSLAESARAAGRAFRMTGYVPADALPTLLHGVTVPVAHHRHVSASGSLNTWIAAHRRPLAPLNRYTAEHADRHPGTLRLYPDTAEGLAEAIETALREPDSTWLAEDGGSGSTPAQAAAWYAAALAGWHD